MVAAGGKGVARDGAEVLLWTDEGGIACAGCAGAVWNERGLDNAERMIQDSRSVIKTIAITRVLHLPCATKFFTSIAALTRDVLCTLGGWSSACMTKVTLPRHEVRGD